jgi:glycosyltransferase involved in cell wall biosynthesis
MPGNSPSYFPRLLLVIPDSLPSATIYIIKPLTELERQNRLKFSVTTEAEATVARLHASDIVLFCRNIEPSSDWILEECLYRGIPTVYDLDDNLWEVPEGLKYTAYYNAPERIQQMERFLSRVNLVRVYSKPLVERAMRFNSNVNLVVPCIDMKLVPRVALPRRDNKIRITYVTGRGSSDSLISLFSQDLLKLLDAYPDTIEMYWWGEVPPEFAHHPSTRLVPIIHEYDQYLHYLSHEGFDIGLAPLTPTSFNLSKTNTKFRDYGACRIPGIYSDVEVYSCCVEHEKTGLLVRNVPGAWFEAMQRLLIDIELREQIKEAAYKYVDSNYRQELVELQWLELIDALLAARHKSAYAPLPASRPSLCVSLNVETTSPPGFISVSPQAAPGVQVIAAPDQPLPFAADCVDALLADQFIERGDNPALAMAEIYRVCRHGAQVSLYARYSISSVLPEGEDRPYSFNEETPRRWTQAEPPVYQIQAGRGRFEARANLAPGSVAPAAGIDLRCLGMEFFDSPAYLSLPEQQKRHMRQQDAALCQRILYHCVAVKRPILEEDWQHWMQIPFVDPPEALISRLRDDAEILKDAVVQNHAEIRDLREKLRSKEIEVITRNSELELQMPLARLLAQEMDAYRNRKIIRLIERLIDRVDYAAHISSAYRQMLDDSLIFFHPLKGYRLRPSQNLQRVPHLTYPIRLPRSGLRRLSIAAVIDLYPRVGMLGVQILGRGKVLGSAVVSARDIRADAPVVFSFYPIANEAGERVELQIYARDLDAPLRIYEWHRYPFWGLGDPQVKPFCSFDFYSSESRERG